MLTVKMTEQEASRKVGAMKSSAVNIVKRMLADLDKEPKTRRIASDPVKFVSDEVSRNQEEESDDE